MQTKTIAMILLLVIATVGAIGIGIEITQSSQAFDFDDSHGQSFHDSTGDAASHGFLPSPHP